MPEHFFLERYRAAYALEMAHFFDALAKGAQGAHVDRGRREGAGARRRRDDVVARKADRGAMSPTLARLASGPTVMTHVRHRRRRPHGPPPRGKSRDARAGRVARRRVQPHRRGARVGARQRSACKALYKDYAELLARQGRRRGVPRHAQHAASGADHRRAAGRQARVLRKAAVDGARGVPRGRSGSREASASQGDDRLRAPLRRELPGRAEEHRGGRDRPAVPRALANDRPERSVGLLRQVRADLGRHLRRHERARHRHRALAPGLAQGLARVLARHRRRPRGPARLRRRRQRRCDVRVRRRPHGVLLRVAHDGARARDRDRDHRHRRPPHRRPRRAPRTRWRSRTRTASAR